MSSYMQGKFRPLNPSKYKGDPTNIVYRSSWELSAMARLDKDPGVVWWSSEEVIVPYSNPLKGGDSKFARYFPDLAVCRRGEDGVERVTIYEIKPAAQTQMPKKTKGKGKRRMTAETAEFAKNMAKWEAADRYCKKRGWTFQILTEKELKLGDSTWQ